MTNLTTHEITVSAESTFQQRYSQPMADQFVFSYRIRITNESSRAIQLVSRKWEVIDGAGQRRFVDGEGVVGQQPRIQPGKSYEYTSWVQLRTPLGAMQGSYTMVRQDRRGRESAVEVRVPRFLHTAPQILN